MAGFDGLRAKYQGYSDDEILGALQATKYPDYSIEEIGKAVGYEPRKRGLMAVANDTVIEAANATAGAVGAAANFISPGNRVSSFIDEKIIRPGEASQSDVTQQSRRQFQEEVEQADGFGGELMAVVRKVMRDPLLTAAQAAGSFAIPGMAVKAAGGAAGALGSGAAGVSRAGLAGGATAGAALSGGDAAGTAYDLVIKAGGSEQEAVEAARQASVLPAAVGGLGGVIGAERLLAGAGGVKGGLMARAFKTAGIEGVQEGFEEGITQYEGQRAAMPFDSAIDPWKGVGAAAGMGAVMGGGIGGAAGALSANPVDAERRLATAPDVGSMVQAATDLAMTPLALPAPPTRLQVDDVLDENGNVIGPATRGLRLGYTPPGADPLALPAPDGPPVYMADAQGNAALQPAAARAEAINRNFDARHADETAAEFIRRRKLEMGKQTPRGDEPIEKMPVGEVSRVDLIPAGEATDWEYIPHGQATEIDPEIIQADDFKTADDMPYGTQSGAVVRARREGLTPAEVVKVAGGWVVRPQPTAMGAAVDGRPNNTRSTTAADVLRSNREPVTDLAGTTSRLAGPADGRGDQRDRSIGAVRPVPDGAGGLVQDTPAPTAGRAADAALENGAAQPGPPLTTGSRVNFDGKTWTVIDASPRMIRLDDGQGMSRAISSTSAKWKQITPADPLPAEQGTAAAQADGKTEELSGLMAESRMLWSDIEQAIGRPMRMDDPRHIDVALRYVRRKNTELDAQSTPVTPRTQAPEPAAAAARAAGGAMESDGVRARKTLQEARSDASLDKDVSENGTRMTRRQWVDGKVTDGLKTRATQEDRIKPMSKMQFFRASNDEQRDHDRKIKEAGKKDVFWIGDYEVTKTEHDYALRLSAAGKATTTPPKAGNAAEQAVDRADAMGLSGRDRREAVSQDLGMAWGMTADEVVETDEFKAAIAKRPRKAARAAATERSVADVVRQAGAAYAAAYPENATAPVEAASESVAAAPGAVAPDVSTNGEKTNTSAERVRETPKSEQVTALKDRVDARRKPADAPPADPAATAPPAADSAPAPAPPDAATPTDNESLSVAEPKTKRPPKSFRKKHQVWTSVFVEESGKFEQRDTDADTALKALDEDVAEMTAFRKCLTGG